ncbi:Exopolyphosphatase [Microsporum ferrugineum]
MNKSRRRCVGLLSFLKTAAQFTQAPFSSVKPQPTYVLGNTSADLDSIISAIIYSYFATSAQTQHGLQYIPAINLADVPAGRELRRLRPEFTTALNLATQRPLENLQTKGTGGLKFLPDDDNTDNLLNESILTVAELRHNLLSWKKLDDRQAPKLNVFMVDWNALPKVTPHEFGVHGLTDRIEDVSVSVVGCIDHHEDEGFVSKYLTPRSGTEASCIQTGVGSCTSLIIRELRNRGWWNDHSSPMVHGTSSDVATPGGMDECEDPLEFESQAAQLALAAILADTANMTMESKVSDVDREAVKFLENKIKQCSSIAWDRDMFYHRIMDAKSSSVDYLTAQETLGRDYKEWVKSVRPGHNVKIGICSVVKPVSWLLEKCKSEYPQEDCDEEAFFNVLSSFSQARNLDVAVIMAAFSSPPENEFQRELVFTILNDEHFSKLKEFEDAAVDYLKLEKRPFSETNKDLPEIGLKTRVWRQLDVTKSRKQVAPLVRKVFTGQTDQGIQV